ncbi:MAG: hypothetical protein ACQ9MH_21315 [Nitrospinales bacterium]
MKEENICEIGDRAYDVQVLCEHTLQFLMDAFIWHALFQTFATTFIDVNTVLSSTAKAT